MKKSYIVTMRHDEKTLIALSHMQYDLFCFRNYIARNVLAIAAILVGGFYFKQIWGIALLAYGTYLLTSTYASANHTARKLIAQINAGGGKFPSSRYFFEDGQIRIVYHPGEPDEEELDPVGYGAVQKLGEDRQYLYLFTSDRGGYMIPKEALGGDEAGFRTFVQSKTGMAFQKSRMPMSRVRAWMYEREHRGPRL